MTTVLARPILNRMNPIVMHPERFWSLLGPGILLAAASVGASHLVLGPQAGALFGYQLLWLVVAAHLFKYPAFEFGPRYAAATGRNLLQGYARIPGPARWPLLVFLGGTLVQGVGVLAGVVAVSGAVLATWTETLSPPGYSMILVTVIVLLLLLGGFVWLDHLNKLMMAILAAATLLAFSRSIPDSETLTSILVLRDPETLTGILVPRVPAGSILLVAAILGWMPTGIDVSVWHSFWTVEKMRAAGLAALKSPEERLDRLRNALWDMRIGYLLSLGTGLMFVILGAVYLAGRGNELQGVEFARELSTAYTMRLGAWMYHVFMLTAFFAMFSTSYTVIDGFSRSFSECCGELVPALAAPRAKRSTYVGFVCVSSIIACVILACVRNPDILVKRAALISLAVAPLLYACNLYCVTRHIDEPAMRPSRWSIALAVVGILVMVFAIALTVTLTVAPQPATPQPATPEPATPQPATPQPASADFRREAAIYRWPVPSALVGAVSAGALADSSCWPSEASLYFAPPETSGDRRANQGRWQVVSADPRGQPGFDLSACRGSRRSGRLRIRR